MTKKRGPPRNPHVRRSTRKTDLQVAPNRRIGRGGSDVNRKQNEDGILSEMQRRFVNHVVHDGFNYTAAARLAGYSDDRKDSWKLMQNPKILKAIEEERASYAEASKMTKKKVIDGFLEAIDMARVQADPTPMIQGWTQIAKMCGYFEPTRHRLEVSVKGEVIIQKLQQLDDNQLLALADGKADVLEGEFDVITADGEK